MWVSLQMISDKPHAYPQEFMGLVIFIFDSPIFLCLFVEDHEQLKLRENPLLDGPVIC